jgi:hypothetical protein
MASYHISIHLSILVVGLILLLFVCLLSTQVREVKIETTLNS